MNKRLKNKFKRLEYLISIWKTDNTKFPEVIKTIKDEELWNLVSKDFQEFLALEFGIPEGQPFSITTGKVMPF